MTFLTPILINYFLYKKKLYNKNLYLLTTTFLLLYIIVAIVIYYNNLSNGYEFGILYGDVLGSHFCDEYRYYMDSEILMDHLKNGDFMKWINGELPIYEFIDSHNHPGYGNYNLYVIILTFLKLLGVHTTLDLILLKLVVYIPTSIYLFKLSKIYLSDKFALISVSIFSLLPGYILINSLLMRDNIILAICIMLFYYIFSKKIKLTSVVIVLLTSLLLFKFRSYTLLAFIICFIVVYKNIKYIISPIDIFYFILIVIGIYGFISFDFRLEHSNELFSYFQIQSLQDNFILEFGTGFSMIIKLFSNLIIHILYDPPFLSFLSSNIIYLILYSLGNIVGTIIMLLCSIGIIFSIIKNKAPKDLLLLKFTGYFILLNGLIVLSKDLFIINRIALMWIPLLIIIFLKFIIEIKNYWYKSKH